MRKSIKWLIGPVAVLLILGIVAKVRSTAEYQPYADLTQQDKDAILGFVRASLAGEAEADKIQLPGSATSQGKQTVFLTLWPSWEMAELYESIRRLSASAASRMGTPPAPFDNSPVPKPRVVRVGSVGPDLRSALASLGPIVRANGVGQEDLRDYRIQIDLLRDLKPLRSESGFFAKGSLEAGVSGVAWSDGGKLYCALPDEAIRLEIEPDKLIGRLKKKFGTAAPTDLPKGLYRFRTCSFIERWPGEKSLSLYRGNARIDPISSDEIERAYLLGGDFLLRLLRDNGKFYYQYHPIKRKSLAADDPDAILGRFEVDDYFDPKGYNLLRHCGTTYSLMQLYDETGLPRYKVGGERALRWMVEQIRPKPDSESGSMVIAEQNDRQAKLGGAGLALLALVTYTKSTGDDSYKRQMEGLAEGICEMQLPDGDFINYVSMTEKHAPKQRRSIYYPGEAILGLVRLYQLDGNRKWLDAAVKGADYLVHDRWKLLWMDMYVPPDAWLMLALEELHEVTGDPSYRDYAYKLADYMIKDQYITRAPYPDWLGGYSRARWMEMVLGPVSIPNVTPAGSRMEGFTAVYLIAEREGDQAMMDKIYRTIKAGCTFQMSTMVRPETAFLYPNPKMAIGAFRRHCYRSMVQIDFNQHNISGLIVARRILQRRGE